MHYLAGTITIDHHNINYTVRGIVLISVIIYLAFMFWRGRLVGALHTLAVLFFGMLLGGLFPKQTDWITKSLPKQVTLTPILTVSLLILLIVLTLRSGGGGEE